MEKEELTIDTLPQEIKALTIQNNQQAASSKKQLSAFDLASAEKIHIQKVMNYTNGNKTKAAELLCIAITTLYRKLEEYHIN
jgi:DNA-binding protein Fis